MALLVDVVDSTVFGDRRVVVADVTFDDDDASTVLAPAEVGLYSILTVLAPGQTDGGYGVSWDHTTGGFALWECDDAAPMAAASTTDADGDVIRVVVIGS